MSRTVNKTLFTLFCLVAVWAMTLSANAQEVRATISGRVMDPQGALVPNATVVVVNEDNNVRQETKTNDQGVWIAQFLLPGHYGFTITAAGFKTEDRKGITLSAGDVKQIDTALQVGSSSQTVDVTADAPLIDTTAAASGTVISHEEIAEMPSSSHVVTLLATFSPGVVAQDQNNNIAHLWSYNAASQFTSDGGRNNVWSNTFQLDGSPDMKAGGDVAFIPPMDSVQEFRSLHQRVRCLHRPPGRRHGQHADAQRRQELSRRALRIQPEQRDECESVPDQPHRRRGRAGAFQ